MKKIQGISLITTILIAFAACTNEIPLRIDNDQEMLILNSIMSTNDSVHHAFIAVSKVTGTGKAPDALLTCFVNGKEVSKGALVKNDTKDPLTGEYYDHRTSSEFTFEADIKPGDIVRLEAVRGSLKASSEVIAPEAPSISSVDTVSMQRWNKDYDLYIMCTKFTVTVDDKYGVDNWYRFDVWTHQDVVDHFTDQDGNETHPDIARTQYFQPGFDSSEDQILNDGYGAMSSELLGNLSVRNKAMVFSDKLFRGKRGKIRIWIENQNINSVWPSFYRDEDEVDEDDEYGGDNYYYASSCDFKCRVDLMVKAISFEEYNYMKALNNCETFGYTVDPVVEPTTIPSNVSGALGFVAVESAAVFSIYYPEGHREAGKYY